MHARTHTGAPPSCTCAQTEGPFAPELRAIDKGMRSQILKIVGLIQYGKITPLQRSALENIIIAKARARRAVPVLCSCCASAVTLLRPCCARAVLVRKPC
jgi:hypothetical protein